MSGKEILGIVLVLAAMVGLWRHGRDPHRTTLPFGSTDLTEVQGALERLSPEERKLVEDYVKRSNGDVLPAAFADPDAPLTARTFAEAIELEKQWREQMRKQEAVAAARRAERDRVLAPLREAVEARVLHSEIIGRDEYQSRTNPGYQNEAHVVEKVPLPIFVTHLRIDNHGSEDVVQLRGSLQARDRDEYLPLDLCWIDTDERRRIPAFGHIETTCANPNRGASPQQRAFAEDAPGRFSVEWEPRTIRFASGRTLESKL